MTLFQAPNLPLIAAIISFVLYNVAPPPASNIFLWIFIVSLTIWSLGEIIRGLNWFRRSLGVIGLGVVGIAVIAAIS